MKFRKIPVKAILKTIIRVTMTHSPEILTAIGISGMVTSTVLAVKATPKAMAAIDEQPNDISTKDKVKVCWKYYVPSGTLTILSAACLISSNSISLRRNAALATAYKLSEAALTDYQEKVVETIGEKKEKTIREEIARDKIKDHPYSSTHVFETGYGDTLCLDSYTGRYFKTDIESIKQAVNKLNYSLLQHNFISLNDFYFELGLESVKDGDDLGWPIEKGLLDITFGSGLMDGRVPCLVLDYRLPVKYEYLYR